MPINNVEALKYFEIAKRGGHEEAAKMIPRVKNKIGLELYEQGQFLEAINNYASAAEEGNFASAYNLGIMYFHGDGVPEDNFQALKWFERSKECGNEDAQELIAETQLFIGRDFLEKDDQANAVMWLKKAQENGNEEAGELLSELISPRD